MQKELKPTEDQPSFLVDLRQPVKTSSENTLLEEDKIMKDQHPDNNKTLKSLLGRIFGIKEKNIKNEQDLSKIEEEEADSKNMFLTKFRKCLKIQMKKIKL